MSTAGYSPECPNCEKMDAYYSIWYHRWVCAQCGLHFETRTDEDGIVYSYVEDEKEE